MIFDFEELCKYYSEKKFPCVNQAKIIANKYKQLYKKEIKHQEKLYLIENCNSYFIHPTQSLELDDQNDMNIEITAFKDKIKLLRKFRAFLKKLGIPKESYLIIYDYENLTTAKDQQMSGIFVNFQRPKIYLVLFEKEHYNFIRLAYTNTETKSPTDYINLYFSFELKEDFSES